MKEETLHQVWKLCLLNNLNCFTTNGDRVQIIHPGFHNSFDAGPDFSTAKIRINNTLWVGNVEIHLKTSDWLNHLHHLNHAYSNVILHVVYEDDMPHEELSQCIHVLELKRNVVSEVWRDIHEISNGRKNKLCANKLDAVNALDWIAWQDRLVIERFDRKIKEVDVLYDLSSKNWDKVCFQLLAKSIGGTVNKEPFMILSKQLNIFFLQKHSDNMIALEAILFGVAGMLNETFVDLYPKKLQQEYAFYKQKYKLIEMENYWWKWLRLRPSSFATIQIGLIASLIFNSKSLESLFSCNGYKEFRNQIRNNCVLSPYWENHYRFDYPSKEKNKNWGEDTIKRVFINGLIPYRLAKAKQLGVEKVENILGMLNEVQFENNRLIRDWKQLKAPIFTSYESQAMLQLTNEYCSRKKCLNCNIGFKILKHSNK